MSGFPPVEGIVFTVVPILCGVLIFTILAYVGVTAGFRSTLQRRRRQSHSLRLELRSALLAATRGETFVPLEPALVKRVRRGWRQGVALEVARSLANDADRQAHLEEVSTSLGLGRVVRKRLAGGTALERAGAAETIGDLHLTTALPELYVAMRDEDMAVRLASAAAFAQIVPDQAAEALTRMLLTEPLPVGAQRLAELIAGLGSRAADPLVAGLQEHPHPLLARLVAHCVPPERALPALVDAANTLDPHVRLEAVRSLGLAASSWSLPALLDATGDTDVFVRSASAVALGQTGDPVAIPALVSLLGDPDHVVRSRSAAAVAVLPGGVDVLTDVLVRTDSSQVSLAAAVALQEHLVTVGVSSLVHADPLMRSAAERAVLALLETTGFSALARALVARHPNMQVRERIRELLAESGVFAETPPAPSVVLGTRPLPELATSRRAVRTARYERIRQGRPLPEPRSAEASS